MHLPILLPLSNLGLIIIDEEHDPGFQEKKHPKLHSKEIALLRAHTAQIPILLGSATPSLQSLYQVEQKKWQHLVLSQRFAGGFPTIITVSLRDKNKRNPHFWISHELEQAITERLEKKEQVIIFLNRRGYSFFIQCTACSFIPTCTDCSVSLTVHADKSLRCHYCAYQTTLIYRCSSCNAPESALLKKGIGTEQIVALLEKLFPTARSARADLDSTINKKKWQKLWGILAKGPSIF